MKTKRPLFSQQKTARYLRELFRVIVAREPYPHCPECHASMSRESWARGHVDGCDLFHAMRAQRRKSVHAQKAGQG